MSAWAKQAWEPQDRWLGSGKTQEEKLMSDDRDRKPSFHPPTERELARLIAVVAGVVGLFGLALWIAQE
jgi:hypothetical protein